MSRRRRGRLTPLQAGLIALGALVLVTLLAFTKDIPFTTPYQVSAVFENAPPLRTGTAVRIAGVDVGEVSAVESIGGDSPATKVTMKLDDEALPLHEDSTFKVRPRILFEGSDFIDVNPGSPSADSVDDGHEFPVTQTAAPVQLDEVLGTLQTDTRDDLRRLLAGYGAALDGRPRPGEDADQDPSTRGETAGRSLNDSLLDSPAALRGGAVVSQALLGTELHDLSQLVGGSQRVLAALASRETQLRDLLTNWNVSFGALAAERDDLRATVRLLPRLLEAANPALDDLNAAFPSTRAWALEMVPGVEELPATIDAGFPWVRQARALLRRGELRGLVAKLDPAIDDFARFTSGQLTLIPKLDAFNRCQYGVVLPTGEQTIEDGNLSTGLASYKELWQTMVGFAGENQDFDGNGSYNRFQAGGGAYRIQTGPVGAGGPLFAHATAPPLGTRPARTRKPPYKPDVACHRNRVPNLNAARIGGGP